MNIKNYLHNKFLCCKEIYESELFKAEIKQYCLNHFYINKYQNLMNIFDNIHKKLDCPHNPSHILSFINAMFQANELNKEGCFVEAGCYKGGSSSKFSHVAKLLGKKLIIFDSFQGLPKNKEEHIKSNLGHSIENWFEEGKFCGTLNEVKSNLEQYGQIDSCEFIEGWFDQTMPDFHEPILAAYIDVDLAESTKTCLKYLYPLLVKDGYIYSQDGDFPLVVEVFQDKSFWENEIGVEMPVIKHLTQKIICIKK